MTLREFKEEIEGSMLILLVMPMKKNPTLAPLTLGETPESGWAPRL